MVNRRSSTAALAGALATVTVGASSHPIIKLEKNQQRINSHLLRNARPYKTGANESPTPRRHLDGNEFEIDASYSIKFSQCVDLKTYDEDLFDEDVVEYTVAGQITSTQSYVLFHACQDNDCYYASDDDLYIVDLATYVMNMASYHANVKEEYCDACDLYYNDFCVAAEDDAVAANDDAVNDDAANDGDDDAAARRKLQQNQRRATSYIECDQCEAYGCVNNGDDGQQQDENLALGLIEDISQCLNTGLNWNDDALYVGFMCSPYDGDGVELAIFLDNQCTVYTSLKAFSDIPSWYIYSDADMFSEAETYIKNAFTETTTCQANEFGDPAYQNNGNDDAAAANGDDGYEVNDYCSGLFEEGPMLLNSCVQSDDQNNDNNNNDDDQYNWYTYDMNYDNARDLEEVCAVVQQMEGEYEYHYDAENSGTWNDHSNWWGGDSGSSSSKKSGKGVWGFLGGGSQSQNSGFSATSGIMIFLYVILGFALIIGVLFIIGVHERKKREKTEDVYRGGRLV